MITETKRLVLRQFDMSDGPALDCVFGDAEVMRFGPGVQSAPWVRDWLRRNLENYRKREYGLWAVVTKAEKAILGYCGLSYFPDVGGRPETEIGYRLARPFWGRGYATEAAIAVRDYGIGKMRLTRLVSLIDPQNLASIRVAEKLGMRYEKDVMLPGYDHPDRVYAVERFGHKELESHDLHSL